MDLVHVPPFISNLELQWEDPAHARYMRRLASFSRLIMFDKRGTGLSDRVDVASLDERMDDVRAVMDAAGSERAAVFGSSEGGALAILFSVTYPERVSALVLYGAYPRMSWAPDYPNGVETSEESFREFEDQWGQVGGGIPLSILDPGRGNDPASLEAAARSDRLSASPGAAASIMRMIIGIDVRDLLPAIRVPTLVVYRTADIAHAEGSRYLGAHIPGGENRRAARRRLLPVSRRPGRGPGRDRGVPDRSSTSARSRSRLGDGALHRHRRINADRGAGRRSAVGASCWSITRRSQHERSNASAVD